jgi:type VI protein secretion system component Hcp
LRNSKYVWIVATGQNANRWSRFSIGIQRSERKALEVVNDTKLAMLPDDHGRPLLFKAVSNHERIAEVVLNDPNLARIEHNGLTVAHIAVAHHRIMAQKLLDQKSPLLNLKSNKGLSVELFARINLECDYHGKDNKSFEG